MVEMDISGDFEMRMTDVCNVLNITRTTLKKLVENGVIKAEKTETGRYIYDTDSVYEYRKHSNPRLTCIYLTNRGNQKEITKQEKSMQKILKAHNLYMDLKFVDKTEAEIKSNLYSLLHLICNYKVKAVVINGSDFSELEYNMFSAICSHCNTEIILYTEEC